MRLKTTILCFISLASLFTFAGDDKDFIKNLRENYDNLKSCEMQFTYKLFKGYGGKEVKEEYNSTFYKNEDGSYRTISDNIFISNSELNIKINNDFKEITLSDSKKLSPADFDIEDVLKFCQDTRILQKGNSKTLVIIFDKKANVEFNRIDIEVNEDYWMNKMVMYYNSPMNFANSHFKKDMAFPKLEITYNEIKKKWKDKNQVLQLDNYLDMTAEQPVGNGFYKDYKISDFRSKK